MMPFTSLRRALGGALVLACVAGCSRDELLGVATPDQITPASVNSVAGAQALRAAAIGIFSNYYSGTTNVGLNLYVGLLSDELVNARPGADHIDIRSFNENVFPNVAWNNFAQAYTALVRASRSVNEFYPVNATKSSQLGQLYVLRGYALTTAGEAFCNGVPLSDVNDESPSFTTQSNVELQNQAIAAFDSALSTLGSTAADVSQRYAARVGKARALVNLKRYTDAAAVTRAGGDGGGSVAVPTGFIYNMEYSATTLVNTIFDWMVNTANFGPSDREGGNGLDWRSANDARVVVSTTSRLGQDGSTRVFTIQGYPNGASPTILASGVEARMIEAESDLSAGNAPGWLASLNAARADAGARTARSISNGAPDVLPPLADPGSEAARVDLLFRERGFWMYLQAHRVGDLRRLVRQYGRGAETVWPTGAYFKGGTYGTDQNITPSIAERNNPTWEACTNRDP
ncbi:MAG: hypothetical protein ABI910_20220 [Gemmatimonadota bacterium]